MALPTQVFAKNLTYDIEYLSRTKQLQVDVTFQLDKETNPFFILPNAWGGHQKLYQHLKIQSIQGGTLKPTKYPYVKKIMAPKNSTITIRYLISQGFKGEPRTPLHGRQPIIQSDYFHFIGVGAFAYPMIDKEKIIDFNINWNIPKKWNIVNSFHAEKTKQSFSSAISDFVLGTYLAGNFRLQNFNVNRNPVWLALGGEFKFTDNAMKRVVEIALKTERDFWSDNYFPHYLVSILSIKSNKHVISGLGLTNAFAAFIPSTRGIDRTFTSLLMHEIFHHWNTPSIFESGAKDQESKYWFTEGFTDYFAEVLAIRSGLTKLLQYISHYNGIVEAYMTSEFKNIPNSELPKRFWSDYHIQKIPYQRGNLFAHYANAEIKKASEGQYSFDDAIKEMIVIDNPRDKNAKIHTKKDYLTYDEFHSILKKYWPNYREQYWQDWIIDGKNIPIHPNALGPCVKLTQKSHSKIDLGFDTKFSVAKGIIQKLRPNSRAYQSGIRNGQILIDLHVNTNNPKQPVTVLIKDKESDTKPRKVSYIAEVDKSTSVPFYRLDMRKVSFEPESCLTWFGVN